jgi:hypothetical protein
VNRLTKQEQLVLCVLLGLLLTGWAVKTYRMSHPPAGMNSNRLSQTGNLPITPEEQASR